MGEGGDEEGKGGDEVGEEEEGGDEEGEGVMKRVVIERRSMYVQEHSNDGRG